MEAGSIDSKIGQKYGKIKKDSIERLTAKNQQHVKSHHDEFRLINRIVNNASLVGV